MGLINFFMRIHPPKSYQDFLGTWERVGDDFEGCVIKVSLEGREMIGTIIWIVPSMIKYGWQVGDKKWRKISSTQSQKSEEVLWELFDLRKEYDTANKKVLSTDYARYWISLSGKRKLYLHQSKIPLFPDQIWHKIG